jgi:catecholate siderophore receptor
MPFKFKTGLLIASIASIASMPAVAQSTSVDEIVVTSEYNKTGTSALKMPIPLVDVPQSLTIIGQEEIKLRGYGELGDLVRYTPGLNTTQGEGHRDAIVFRGVRSTADFFLDGVRDDVQYYRPLYNLEQVEILRGPNALLFGRGGTGGAINRVTKKAVIGNDSSSADLSVDTFGAYNLAADVNVATSDNSALRVNAFVETLENDRDFYDGDRYGINPTYRRAIDNQTTLDLSVELMDHERFIDRGIPTSRTTGEPDETLADIVFGSPTDNTSTLEATLFNGSLTREYSDTSKLVFNVNYGDYEKMYQNLYADGYDANAGTVTLKGYRDPTERTRLQLGAYLVNELTVGGRGHTLLLGGEYIDTENDNHRFNPTFTAGGSTDTSEKFDVANPLDLSTNSAGQAVTLNFNTDKKTATETDVTVTSLYFQDQIDVSEKLQVLLGARYDSVEISVTERNKTDAELAALFRARTVTSEDDQTSTRFGLIYKPQSNVSLYASMSESFLPRAGEQYKKMEAVFDPDEYENTEFGIKWNVSETLNLSASFFDNEAEVATENQNSIVTVQGLAVDGYELQLNGQISDQTSISLAYSSMDGERNAAGADAYELPETMYSVFVQHQANERLNYGIGLTYQDESLVKSSAGHTPTMPDYTRIDASLSYIMSDDMTLRVNIENLADEDYYPHSHSTHQVSVGDPMNAKISLSRSF